MKYVLLFIALAVVSFFIAIKMQVIDFSWKVSISRFDKHIYSPARDELSDKIFILPTLPKVCPYFVETTDVFWGGDDGAGSSGGTPAPAPWVDRRGSFFVDGGIEQLIRDLYNQRLYLPYPYGGDGAFSVIISV